jgi:hypothetical protein
LIAKTILKEMLENCHNCLCPNNQATVELDLEKALHENDLERKQLIKDLEKAGVTFPVTELETLASPVLLGPRADPEACHDDHPGDFGEDAAGQKLTWEDYATNMPDDLKNLLRRYYQLEAERENLKAGASTAPNSENGETEEPPLQRMSTPRPPFWFFRNGSVAVVEGPGDCEAQERSSKSRHVWLPGKTNGVDGIDPSSRVTVVYPKEHTRKIRCGALICCLTLIGLISVIVYYATDNEVQATNNLPNSNISGESSAVSEPTSVPCTPQVEINKKCFVRGEPVGTRFQNCDPRKSLLWALEERPTPNSCHI